MEITITIKMDENELKNSKIKQESLVKEQKIVTSQYAKFYDETCNTYHDKPEYNLMFLRQEQLYATDLLRVKGHLFLNEVYEMLGMPKTKVGQLVGWIYDEENPIGDNFVDFGIKDLRLDSFTTGKQNAVLLDFNVDGVILDRI